MYKKCAARAEFLFSQSNPTAFLPFSLPSSSSSRLLNLRARGGGGDDDDDDDDDDD